MPCRTAVAEASHGPDRSPRCEPLCLIRPATVPSVSTISTQQGYPYRQSAIISQNSARRLTPDDTISPGVKTQDLSRWHGISGRRGLVVWRPRMRSVCGRSILISGPTSMVRVKLDFNKRASQPATRSSKPSGGPSARSA